MCVYARYEETGPEPNFRRDPEGGSLYSLTSPVRRLTCRSKSRFHRRCERFTLQSPDTGFFRI